MSKEKKKNDKVFGFIPQYSVIPLLSAFGFNTLVYSGTMTFISDNRVFHDLSLPIDKKVPLLTGFMGIYVASYVFWALNYILASTKSKEDMYRFVASDMCSRVVCLLFFVFYPTTIVRPEIVGNGFFDNLTAWMYSIDKPQNLFPSIHCLVSWFSVIGIRRNEKIPKWYKILSVIIAILICLSTQFTKQHYIVDLVGGIALAELSYYFIGKKSNLYIYFGKFFTRVNKFFKLE